MWSWLTEGMFIITEKTVRLTINVPIPELLKSIPRVSVEAGKLVLEWSRHHSSLR